MKIRALFFLLALSSPLLAADKTDVPKNVILLISDGAGVAHYTAAKYFRGADFNIGRMTLVALSTTNCADRTVTDSSAAASALATGVKVPYEAMSLEANGNAPVTALEVAEKAGKRTGLVTTSYFYDATPGAFAAHVKDRHVFPPIIDQMLKSGVDLIIGTDGGAMTKKEVSVPELAAQNGYTFVIDSAALANAKPGKLLAVFPEQENDLDVPGLPLAEMARIALQRLRGSDKGFFVMIEHEGTDSSSHANSRPDLQKALISFDETVGVALDFAKADGNTLVIVTSDHETGGMRLSESKTGKLRLEFSTIEHTASAVPLFAFGKGVGELTPGMSDDTDVGKTL
ncbi:MAG TPA: alkaline phosphatase, partial [Thermoanaerobaculia bacterium]|nr:alkaline phosphatase [Thermoanaerobaculia bacterium]